MRANRRTDTKPELLLRHALHRLGYRYRKDYRLDLASGRRVRPDIAFTARKVAVFVDGCFWHACPEHGSKPRANEWYWSPKLTKNVERDRVNDAALSLAGWTVVRLWEHVPLDEAVATVITALAVTDVPGPATATDPAVAITATDPAVAITATDPAVAITATDPAVATTATDPAVATTATDPAVATTATDPAVATTATDPAVATTATDPAVANTATDRAAAASENGPPNQDRPGDTRTGDDWPG